MTSHLYAMEPYIAESYEATKVHNTSSVSNYVRSQPSASAGREGLSGPAALERDVDVSEMVHQKLVR